MCERVGMAHCCSKFRETTRSSCVGLAGQDNVTLYGREVADGKITFISVARSRGASVMGRNDGGLESGFCNELTRSAYVGGARSNSMESRQ